MAVARTRTIKNKHASNKAGVSGSKSSRKGPTDGVVKSRSFKAKGVGMPPSKRVHPRNPTELVRKKKRRMYTPKELGIPELNKITPVGVVKPKGLKKGKVFVDDTQSMATILAVVQAEKNGHVESKMIKARQMEEIREARKAEAETREETKKFELEKTKDEFRKRRKRKGPDHDGAEVRDLALTGSKAKKTRVKAVNGGTDGTRVETMARKGKKVTFSHEA